MSCFSYFNKISDGLRVISNLASRWTFRGSASPAPLGRLGSLVRSAGHLPACFPSFHPPDTFFVTLQGSGVSVSVLPFGLKDFPWIFFRLVSVVLASLRQSGIGIFLYLNDWLLIAYSMTLLELLLQKTLELTHRLGFLVNLEKSSLTPSQIPSFLGASLDIPGLLARPLPQRVEALQSLVSGDHRSLFLPRQDLAGVPRSPSQFHGLDSSVQVVYAPSLTSPPEVLFLRAGTSLPDLFPSPSSLKSLSSVGISGVPSAGKALPPSVDVFRRVQPRMGAFLHPYHVSGVWSPQEARLHINSLELLAVFLALQNFRRSDLRTIDPDSIRLLHGGFLYQPSGRGSLPPPFASLVSSVGLVSGERFSPLSLPCPRGRQPTDGPPLQGKFLPSEWTLNHSVFQRICLFFPPPEIDLFASALTFQLPKYCSKVQDLQAWAIDAMSFPWSGLRLYAFPPFSLLPRVLQIVAQDGADLLLITPLWPQKPWFLRLLSLLVDFPRSLPPLPDLVHQPISLFPHPHPDRLHLSLWPLSGNVAKRQAFLRGLPTLSPILLGHPPDALMTIDWQASLNGVPSLRVIRILPLYRQYCQLPCLPVRQEFFNFHYRRI